MAFDLEKFQYRHRALFSLVNGADIPYKGGARLVAEAPEFFAGPDAARATQEYGFLRRACEVRKVILFIVPNMMTLLCGKARLNEAGKRSPLADALKSLGFPEEGRTSPAAYSPEDIAGSRPGIIWLG